MATCAYPNGQTDGAGCVLCFGIPKPAAPSQACTPIISHGNSPWKRCQPAVYTCGPSAWDFDPGECASVLTGIGYEQCY